MCVNTNNNNNVVPKNEQMMRFVKDDHKKALDHVEMYLNASDDTIKESAYALLNMVDEMKSLFCFIGEHASNIVRICAGRLIKSPYDVEQCHGILYALSLAKVESDKDRVSALKKRIKDSVTYINFYNAAYSTDRFSKILPVARPEPPMNAPAIVPGQESVDVSTPVSRLPPKDAIRVVTDEELNTILDDLLDPSIQEIKRDIVSEDLLFRFYGSTPVSPAIVPGKWFRRLALEPSIPFIQSRDVSLPTPDYEILVEEEHVQEE
jgi:hypothetical protein